MQINPGSAALGWHETGPEVGCFGPEWAHMFAEGFEKATLLDALICIPVSLASILPFCHLEVQAWSSIVGFCIIKN